MIYVSAVMANLFVLTHSTVPQLSRKDLLALDFEGALRYFRVALPKRYRSEENARELINTAVALKVILLFCYYVILVSD